MKHVLLAVLAFLALAVAWSSLPISDWIRLVVDYVDSLGSWAILVYFAIYFGLATMTFPTTPLNVGAGLVFHLAVGFPVALLAGALASSVTFLFSRYVAHDWARRRLDLFPKCEQVIEAVEEQAFKIVLLARLNPFIPSSVKNFGFGVTSMPYWKYASATLLGQAPIVFAYVYLGWAGSATLVQNNAPNSMHYTFLGVGVAVSLAMLGVFSWYGRRTIKSE